MIILNEANKNSYMDKEEFIAQKNNTNRGPNLKNLVVEGTFVGEDDMGFNHVGSVSVGKRFKPTISDLKLLIGTKEWDHVKKEMNIDENTVDHLAQPQQHEEQGLNDF